VSRGLRCRDMKGIQEQQESYYTADVEYRGPHLREPLYGRLVSVLRGLIGDLRAAELPLSVLEIGAGHGGYTAPALAAGCCVTAVEMSRPSLARLDEKFGSSPNFNGVFDLDGGLADVGEGFSLILYVSVLHHIPDYLKAVELAISRLVPGGALLSLQDPIWYPRQGRLTRGFNKLGYYTVRLGRSDLKRGAATLLRRMRGGLDETNPSDMVEYHVVRKGVDESALRELLARNFEDVQVIPYWSNQSAIVHRIGTRLRLQNTFGIRATGYRA
jgi:SAM-dependent methyltransferase